MVHIQANTFICAKSSRNGKTSQSRKVIMLEKMFYKNEVKVGCFIGFFHLPKENLSIEECYVRILIGKFAYQY